MKRPFALLLALVFIINSCNTADTIVKTELLIIGGGASGTNAGIQAARLGIQTIIVEETPWLGGMLTAAGVPATDGNHQLPSGLWAEFRQRLYDHYGGPKAVSTGWVSHTLFEPHVGDSIFKVMTSSEPNLKVLYNTDFVEIQKEGNKVLGAVFRDKVKNSNIRIDAKMIIDASELGDVSAAAGVSCDIGMESRLQTSEDCASDHANDIIQDLTYVAILKDYGTEADRTIPKPENYQADLFNCACSDLCDDDSTKVVNCKQMLEYARLPNNKFMINWPIKGNDYYINPIKMTRTERLDAYEKAKEFTYAFVYYIQTALGFKNLGLADDEYPTDDRMPFIPYHRESRRIHGLVRFTVNDVLEPFTYSQLYKTAVIVGDYPVDHHHGRNPNAPEIEFPNIPSFSVPLGVMIPKEIQGLITAEKSISVSNIINGSTRLQPIVLLIGQAAGALAAHCIKNGIQPAEADIRNVQQLLLDAGVYLMPYIDIAPENAHFQSIQKMGACGILKGHGVSFHWANQTWIYPDSLLTMKAVMDGLGEIAEDLNVSIDNPEKIPVDIVTLTALLKTLNNTDEGSSKGLQDLDLSFLDPSYFEEHWSQWDLEDPFDKSRPLTRKEFAVLIDRTIQPFERITIDFDGNSLY